MDMFETRTMLEPLETQFSPRTFLLNTFFDGGRTHDTVHVDIDIVKGKRKMAPFVAPRAEGRVIKREGRVTRSYRPPYVKPKRVTEAEKILAKRATGATPYSGPSPQQRAAEELGKDMMELTEMIVRREEWMAAQALFTGKIIVTGIIDEGDDSSVVNDEIDFQMSASHKITLTGGDLWTEANSKPMNNLRGWKRVISKDSGRTGRVAVYGQDVIEVFVDNTDVQKKMDMRRVDMGQIDPQSLPDGVTYWGYLKDPGIDIYTYDEWYLDDDGNEQPMVPVDRVLLGATNARATRHYGAIQDLDAIEQGLVETRYYPKSWRTKGDVTERFLMVQSAPLVVPHEINAFMSIKVI